MNLLQIFVLVLLFTLTSCGGNGSGSSTPKLEMTNPEIAREAGSKMIAIPIDLKKFNGPIGNIYYHVLAQGKNLLVVHNKGLSYSTDGGRTFTNDTSVSYNEYNTFRADGVVLLKQENGLFSVDVSGHKKFLFQESVQEWNYGQFCSMWSQTPHTCSDDGFATSYTIANLASQYEMIWVKRKDHKNQMLSAEGIYTWNTHDHNWDFEKRTWPEPFLSHFSYKIPFLQIPTGEFYVKVPNGTYKWMKVSEDFKKWEPIQLNKTPERIVRQGDRELFQFLIEKGTYIYDRRGLYSLSPDGTMWTKEFEASDFFFDDNLDIYLLQAKTDDSDVNRLDQLYFFKKGSEKSVLLERPVSHYFSYASNLYTNRRGYLLADTPVGEILSTDGGLTATIVRDLNGVMEAERVIATDDGFYLFPKNSYEGPGRYDTGPYKVFKVSPRGSQDLKWPHLNFTNRVLDLAEQGGVIFGLGSAGVFQLAQNSWVPIPFPGGFLLANGKLTVKGDQFLIFTASAVLKMDKQGKIVSQSQPFKFSELDSFVDLGELGMYVFGKDEITIPQSFFSIDQGQTWKSFTIDTDIEIFARDKTVFIAGLAFTGFETFDPYKGVWGRLDCRGLSPQNLWSCPYARVGKVVEANGGNYFLNYTERKLQFVKDF